MAAPTYAATGTLLSGSSSTTASVPIPAGVATNSVIIVRMYVETTQAVTPPAGFTEDTNSPATVTGASAHCLRVFWKRQTSSTGAGETTGTYAFTIASGLTWRQAYAERYEGVITSGNPFDATNSAVKSTTADGTIPGVSVTTAGPNRLLVWASTQFNLSVCTPPTGFTKRTEDTGNGLVSADKVQNAAGSTGSLTASYSGNNATSAWMGALIPADASGGGITFVGGGFSSATTITIPAHVAGDLIIIGAVRQVNAAATVPAAGSPVPTWVDVDANTGANTASLRVVRAFGTGSTTSGTWSDATRLVVGVWRGVDQVTPIGGHSESGSTGVASIAPSVTMTRTDGTSTLAHIHYCKSLTSSTWASPPAGYSRQVSSTGSAIGLCINTKDITTSDGSVTQGAQTSTGYRGASLELLAAALPGQFFVLF